MIFKYIKQDFNKILAISSIIFASTVASCAGEDKNSYVVYEKDNNPDSKPLLVTFGTDSKPLVITSADNHGFFAGKGANFGRMFIDESQKTVISGMLDTSIDFIQKKFTVGKNTAKIISGTTFAVVSITVAGLCQKISQ
ncbi:MAG: hypothetical protein KAH32_00825 [Chlamydiia bacterium]|nr:hypothetical protein [Chlamydiia bacterium]